MPMFQPQQHPDFAMYKYIDASMYVTYIYDQTKVNSDLHFRASFSRRRANSHIAVLCAIPDVTGRNWTVTNMRAVEGTGAGAFLYHLALQDLKRIRPDECQTQASVDLIRRHSEDSKVSIDADGMNVLVGRPKDLGTSSMYMKHLIFIERQAAMRGVSPEDLEDDMMFAVLNGFAVIDMERST